jgi:hypothetical protein
MEELDTVYVIMNPHTGLFLGFTSVLTCTDQFKDAKRYTNRSLAHALAGVDEVFILPDRCTDASVLVPCDCYTCHGMRRLSQHVNRQGANEPS